MADDSTDVTSGLLGIFYLLLPGSILVSSLLGMFWKSDWTNNQMLRDVFSSSSGPVVVAIILAAISIAAGLLLESLSFPLLEFIKQFGEKLKLSNSNYWQWEKDNKEYMRDVRKVNRLLFARHWRALPEYSSNRSAFFRNLVPAPAILGITSLLRYPQYWYVAVILTIPLVALSYRAARYWHEKELAMLKDYHKDLFNDLKFQNLISQRLH